MSYLNNVLEANAATVVCDAAMNKNTVDLDSALNGSVVDVYLIV
jgi:hypothetical protein